jgi:hypothetical protein
MKESPKTEQTNRQGYIPGKENAGDHTTDVLQTIKALNAHRETTAANMMGLWSTRSTQKV